MKKYICSVCKKELTQLEVNRYLKEHEGLDFNWGKCQEQDAKIIVLKELKNE